MKYEIKSDCGTVGHIYNDKTLTAAKYYVDCHPGTKVIERKTGKIIYPEKQNEKAIYSKN
jgi:hypothetical protein